MLHSVAQRGGCLPSPGQTERACQRRVGLDTEAAITFSRQSASGFAAGRLAGAHRGFTTRPSSALAPLALTRPGLGKQLALRAENVIPCVETNP